MKRMGIAVLAVGMLGGVAGACINDKESANSEKQFSSRYEKTAAQPAPVAASLPAPIAVEAVRVPVNRQLWSATAVTAGVSGLVLIAGAMALTVRKLRQ